MTQNLNKDSWTTMMRRPASCKILRDTGWMMVEQQRAREVDSLICLWINTCKTIRMINWKRMYKRRQQRVAGEVVRGQRKRRRQGQLSINWVRGLFTQIANTSPLTPTSPSTATIHHRQPRMVWMNKYKLMWLTVINKLIKIKVNWGGKVQVVGRAREKLRKSNKKSNKT